MFKYLFFFIIITGCASIKHNVDQPTSNHLKLVEFNYNFAEGNKNKLLGNSNQAILNFIRCLELDPDNGAVFYSLSDIYQKNGEVKKAIDFGKRAYNIDKNNFWYLLHLANLYKYTESLDNAINLYKRIVRIYPSNEEYNLSLALLFFKKQQLKKSVAVLNTYHSKFGITENTSLTLYQIYKYLPDNFRTITVLKSAISRFPDNTRFYGLLAEHYLSLHQMDSSLLYYNKLLEINPNSTEGLLSLIEFYKEKRDSSKVKELAISFINNPVYSTNSKAELLESLINDNNYRNFLSQNLPDVIDTLLLKYPASEKFYLLKANFYILQKEPEKAQTVLEKLVNNFKVPYAVWEQFFISLNSLGYHEKLINYTLQAAQLFPGNPYPYLFAGIGYYNLKDYESSVKVLQLGLQFIKQKTELLVQFNTYLGENYQALKVYDKSEFHFEKVLQINPLNYVVLNNYSYYLALRNSMLDKALYYIEKCIEKEPKSSTYLDTYAWVLFKMGNYSQSKMVIENALMYGGADNMEIIEHYCEILYYNNDIINATKYYKILEENGKSNTYLKNLLQIE